MAVYNFLYLLIIAKLVPLAYGIKKLQISCVVEDDKVCFFFFLLSLAQ